MNVNTLARMKKCKANIPIGLENTVDKKKFEKCLAPVLKKFVVSKGSFTPNFMLL